MCFFCAFSLRLIMYTRVQSNGLFRRHSRHSSGVFFWFAYFGGAFKTKPPRDTCRPPLFGPRDRQRTGPLSPGCIDCTPAGIHNHKHTLHCCTLPRPRLTLLVLCMGGLELHPPPLFQSYFRKRLLKYE